jgi:hypothetical protein
LAPTDERTAQMLDQLAEDFIDHSGLVDSSGAIVPMRPRLRALYHVLGGLREITRAAQLGLDDDACRQSADVLEAVAAVLRSSVPG